MTDLYTPEDEAIPERERVLYEVFNPDHSVGVACDPAGKVVGLHIGDGVRDNTDDWLAAEILLLARLAHQKSRVGWRDEMLAAGTLPYIVENFDLPTAAEYIAMENAAFDR